MKFALWQTHAEPKIAISIGNLLLFGARIASTTSITVMVFMGAEHTE
jgi:hypothetical protein